MALSLIVTGTAWKWILNPGLGLEATVREWGFEQFTFDWLRTLILLFMLLLWQAYGKQAALLWLYS